MVASSKTGCTIGGQYHGGINMCESGVNHPKNPTSGLKGGSLGRSFPNKLPLGESPGYPLFNGWWLEHVGT